MATLVQLPAPRAVEVEQSETPPELLNSITISGMAEHELNLKVGCPVILIRNLQGDILHMIYLMLTLLTFRGSKQQSSKWNKNGCFENDGQSY